MTTPITWAGVLGSLAERRELSSEQASWAMEQILTGLATDAQIGAFLLGLRAKGETAQEVSALMDVMNAHAIIVDVPGVVVDVVGTGGDLSHSVNISTMSALVVAACGVNVVKHGNRAASSQTGAADVLEELGISLAKGREEVAADVARCGIGFCFAPNFHPALRFAGPVRKELGVPTVLNILGPLENPANASTGLVGCANAELAPVMAQALADRGDHAFVVRGDDGLDEITIFTTTQVWDTTSGTVRHHTIHPSDFGIEIPEASALRGGDREENARLLRVTLAEGTGPIADAVRLNAAAALVAHDAATNGGRYPGVDAPVVDRMNAAMADATKSLTSGAAFELLQRWVQG